MGFEYALLHLKYTIPPGIILTFLYRPLINRLDWYKIISLITIAVCSTVPWDSYLIRHKIWTYPQHVTVGVNFYLIPIEEIFFFVIQTYNTTLLYLILNKPLFHPIYLSKSSGSYNFLRHLIKCIIGLLFTTAVIIFRKQNEGTYLALILLWALPFVLLLWSLSSRLLIKLPYTSTILPIVIPTFYLWIVDTVALRRGTWTIENGTKLGIHLWRGFEIEEAIFFLVTNILIVFGLVAFDHALAILVAFPTEFPPTNGIPTPYLLVKALLTENLVHDEKKISSIIEAVKVLKNKSRSFYLASALFPGPLRLDLIQLYAYCRITDDLIDDAKTEDEARGWVNKFMGFLDLSYKAEKQNVSPNTIELEKFIDENFPQSSLSVFQYFPSHILSCRPLYGIIEGFKTDILFFESTSGQKPRNFPIEDERQLEDYAACVAGTIAELFLELAFHHSKFKTTSKQREQMLQAGKRMGIALQYVNIARDVETDARIGRVYLPTSWLKEEDLSHDQVLREPAGRKIEKLRNKLLAKVFDIYNGARSEMSQIPPDARAPIRAAIESYMEIGRVMKEKNYQAKQGKATVPLLRRIKVAWKAMSESDH